MSLVFISHAHEDELLAQRIADLLSDALTLATTEFFLSSQAGRGVEAGHNVRDDIVKQIAHAKALIVVVTPKSAQSPWVWLEVGCRIGCSPASKLLFVVCSERDLQLLRPVADLRALKLNDEGEIQELVKAVADQLTQPSPDYLAYMRAAQALREAATTAAQVDPDNRAPLTTPVDTPEASQKPHGWSISPPSLRRSARAGSGRLV